MKKVLVIVAFVTMFSATAVNAQNFKFGAKGGLNLATLNGKDADDVKMKVGFNLGLVGEYAFNEKMAIQPELLFSAQGADDEDVKDGARKIDFALGVGAGYKLENNLFFDARYTYGLSKIGEDSDDAKVYNGVFQISIGYMF